MKKLLLVGSGFVHTYNFAHLVEPYFDETLLLADKEDSNQDIRTVVLDFSLKKILNQVRTVSAIRKIITDYQPAIIHIHQANSFAWYALRAASSFEIPTVLTAWGSDVLLLPHASFLMKRMVAYNLKHATALTVDAHFMAEAMAQLSGRSASEIVIANFGIDRLKVNPEKENIIYSNRLHNPLYRIDHIIRAFHRFHSASGGSGWKLYIAGTGSETGALKKLVKELGIEEAVAFTGWVDKNQNAEMYARSKIYVSIPESDGTSVSLLEAMAYGCLPVVSDLPANREWINHLQNGFVVKDVDDDFLPPAAQMDWQAAAEINSRIIRERATKESNRKKFITLYDQLLKLNG